MSSLHFLLQGENTGLLPVSGSTHIAILICIGHIFHKKGVHCHFAFKIEDYSKRIHPLFSYLKY